MAQHSDNKLQPSEVEMADIPVVVDESGAQPTSPQELLAKLIDIVSKQVPDYTANLPPALITDLATTAVGALTINDSAMVETINSVTPYGANIPMLEQLGQIYGVQKGRGYNTAVYVVFTGTPGYTIERGFRVSDGNQSYDVQTPTTIPESGQTELVYCIAINTGIWAVPAGTVTKIQTSFSSEVRLNCINPSDGIPGSNNPNWESYRAQVLQAGMVTSIGTPSFLKNELQKVIGVRANLVSYRNVAPQVWTILVGGGDIYQVAGAIYRSIPDISTLTNEVPSGSGDNPPRAVNVSIIDAADTYTIPYLIPNSQDVAINLTFSIISNIDVSEDVVSSLATQPIIDYLTNIQIGDPINLINLESVFVESIMDVVLPKNISNIFITVYIDDIAKPPLEGTQLVYGDPYSYFITSSTAITIRKAGAS